MLKYILIFNYLLLVKSNEILLRKELFNNYSIYTRPVMDFHDSVKLKYGIEIKSLEYFNQKAENIEFNLWITQKWNDEYLKWNTSKYNYSYINIYASNVWIPDLELYNSASKPKVYNYQGNVKLYSNGDIYWVRPTTYSYSCMLELYKFPFDTQVCTMLFGSWKYSSKYLDLEPFNNDTKYKNITVDSSFSHNEWNIVDINVSHQNIEYLCCPGEYYPNTFYSITLKRNYIKYYVVIIMTVFITCSSNILLLFSYQKYKRTFVLIFLPLTIIWLQIYIAGKIPVIEYYTTMEKILLSCFLITTINAFESSILYCISNEKFYFMKYFYNKKQYNYNTQNKNYSKYLTISNENNNLNTYEKLSTHLKHIDNLYKVFVYISFAVIVIYFLN